ncbi:hypothetical protein M569_12647 [Genlisea aurea]|uniref:SHSP domain-containing protein n=1 Tax=Genlisea aurea TaxID=192259 RepID=S8DQS7_9LAMI|nr:hypothetical protein M569_12647 [Genlisea aurea]
MDIRFLGLDTPAALFHALHNVLDQEESSEAGKTANETHVRDARAMASTPSDVKEFPQSYVFVVDMPGLKSGDIRVQVEDDRVLVISGERRREEEAKDGKYLRMERRMGKFLRKFTLPEGADAEKISAAYNDGVLTVTVEKLPPPAPKRPKTVEVKIA